VETRPSISAEPFPLAALAVAQPAARRVVPGRQQALQPARFLDLRRESRCGLLVKGARVLLRDVVVGEGLHDERPASTREGDLEAIADTHFAAGPAPRAVQVDLTPLTRCRGLGPGGEEAGDVEEEVEAAPQNVGFSTKRSKT